MDWLFSNNVVNRVAKAVMQARAKTFFQTLAVPHLYQAHVFNKLLSQAQNTVFGRQFEFKTIKNYNTFCERVPIQSYEQLYPLIERVLQGEQNVLWPGKISWFAKSSGTTNDRSKFIPVPPANLYGNHYKAGKDLFAAYLANRPESQLMSGKVLSIGGSHQISRFNQYARYGDVSAVLIQNMPRYYDAHRAPDRKTALMDEWEAKIEAIANQTIQAKNKIVALAGVPTWTVVLLKRIMEKTGRSIPEVWPKLECFFHGAVAFTPYRSQFESLIPASIMRYVETYNASEGFFAFQTEPQDQAMALLVNHDVFYEFIPLSELDKPYPKSVPLEGVKINQPYALVLSSSNGLWRYLIGDTVRFTSINPYYLKITGRTKQFINAFGEEVVVENAETALAVACQATGAKISDYTAAPIYFGSTEPAGHQWLFEFECPPNNLELFIDTLDQTLQAINTDYEAKRHKNIALKRPTVQVLPPGTFYQWMKSRNKLGGQHKVPRLANDRQYVDAILTFFQDGKLH